MIVLVAERMNIPVHPDSTSRMERKAEMNPQWWYHASRRLGAFGKGRSESILARAGVFYDEALNLLPPSSVCGAWESSLARHVAAAWKGNWTTSDRVVLCGVRVASAFKMGHLEIGEGMGRFFVCPHPSVRSHFWNDAARVAEVRETFSRWVS